MWVSPTVVRTELGPRIGRSGDSPVSDGASDGLAVNSALMWSGWLVMTMWSSRDSRFTRKTSPSWRWVLKLKPNGRRPKRMVCRKAGSPSAGGSSGGRAVSVSGPAGEGRTSTGASVGASIVVATVREGTPSLRSWRRCRQHRAQELDRGRADLGQAPLAVLLDRLDDQLADARGDDRRDVDGQRAQIGILLPRLLDEVVQEPPRAGEGAPQLGDAARAGEVELEREAARQPRVGADQPEPGVEPALEALAQRHVERDAVGDRLQDDVAGGVADREVAVDEVLEVLVERAPRHPRLAHDVGDGGLGEAAHAQRRGHPGEQALAVAAAGGGGGGVGHALKARTGAGVARGTRPRRSSRPRRGGGCGRSDAGRRRGRSPGPGPARRATR